MASFEDLSTDEKHLANRLYSAAVDAVYPSNGLLAMSTESRSRLMQAMVDEVTLLSKLNDPEYVEFLRLKKKFPNG